MPRRKKTNIEPEIESKLKYIGLNLDKVPQNITEFEPLNFRIPKSYDEKQYKQYRYVPVKDIQILLSPTNRLEELENKYKKARPLADYLDNQKEENLLRYTVFLNMLKQVQIEEIEEIEKEQEKLSKKIPFRVKFEGNYLWQIYYSESTDKYFMIVPTEDADYSAFFYLLKKKLENKDTDKIYVPISSVGYSRTYLRKNEFDDIGNYLWLFTKNWPLIYEVYDKKDNLSIHIVGETCIYGNIKSMYKVVLSNNTEANHFYKLLKAMFILQTDLPKYFVFSTNVDSKGNLLFYCKDTKIEYSGMASFIKEQYALGEQSKQDYIKKLQEAKERLEELKQISAMQDIEYLEKEKQISTFLECKKTFFGKFKYYFKYSKKNKKSKMKLNEELHQTMLEQEENEKSEQFEKTIITKKQITENSKKNHTIEELIEEYKEIEKQETELKNVIMDINAIKLKNKNMAKKIENATRFIQEIDNHKRSIFEFWKYSNKDEMSVLPEGEQEEVGVVKKIEKVFDYEEDFEEYGKSLDKLQRKTFDTEETDSIYIATTNVIDILNKIKTSTLIPKDVENTLKELKREQREENVLQQSEEFDIFGGIVQDSTKIKKIGNQSHREQPKDKFNILEINKMTKQIGFKLTLEQIIKNIKNAFEKGKTPEDITIYKAIVDDKIDDNKFNIFNVNPEKEMKEACKQDGKMINLYKIHLKKGENIIGFTNSIFYDNQNKTLPVGMDLSTRVMVDVSKLDLNIKKSKTFSIASLENEEDMFSDIVVKKVTVYE